MSIAYLLVSGTYMLIGAAFYISFPLPKSCIEDVSGIFSNYNMIYKNMFSESVKQFPPNRCVNSGC